MRAIVLLPLLFLTVVSAGWSHDDQSSWPATCDSSSDTPQSPIRLPFPPQALVSSANPQELETTSSTSATTAGSLLVEPWLGLEFETILPPLAATLSELASPALGASAAAGSQIFDGARVAADLPFVHLGAAAISIIGEENSVVVDVVGASHLLSESKEIASFGAFRVRPDAARSQLNVTRVRQGGYDGTALQTQFQSDVLSDAFGIGSIDTSGSQPDGVVALQQAASTASSASAAAGLPLYGAETEWWDLTRVVLRNGAEHTFEAAPSSLAATAGNITENMHIHGQHVVLSSDVIEAQYHFTRTLRNTTGPSYGTPVATRMAAANVSKSSIATKLILSEHLRTYSSTTGGTAPVRSFLVEQLITQNSGTLESIKQVPHVWLNVAKPESHGDEVDNGATDTLHEMKVLTSTLTDICSTDPESNMKGTFSFYRGSATAPPCEGNAIVGVCRGITTIIDPSSMSTIQSLFQQSSSSVKVRTTQPLLSRSVVQGVRLVDATVRASPKQHRTTDTSKNTHALYAIAALSSASYLLILYIAILLLARADRIALPQWLGGLRYPVEVWQNPTTLHPITDLGSDQDFSSLASGNDQSSDDGSGGDGGGYEEAEEMQVVDVDEDEEVDEEDDDDDEDEDEG